MSKVRWHPSEQAVLLSAAFDHQLGLIDVRQPKQAALARPAEKLKRLRD